MCHSLCLSVCVCVNYRGCVWLLLKGRPLSEPMTRQILLGVFGTTRYDRAVVNFVYAARCHVAQVRETPCVHESVCVGNVLLCVWCGVRHTLTQS